VYVIDTNLYIRALRNPAFATELESFQRTALARLWLSAVVIFEVMVGALSDAHTDAFERWLVRPFHSRNRVLVPDAASWRLVARMEREIRSMGGFDRKLQQRSFLNDMLIAATCRQTGATLLTANSADFELLNRVVGVRHLPHFPSL
jgi:predicted nucleic acid-binding protein